MLTVDSLVQVMDSIKHITTESANNTATDSYQWAYWLGGALAVGAIAALGILRYNKFSKEEKALKQKMKTGEVDFDGVINSAFHSKKLADELKRKCHPDLFSTQPELIGKATEIFALVVKNQYDYKALLKLKERAEKELFVHFKI